ncbi:MAG: 2OG-Fe(II) oxygenase [Reichenbachiella sp.]|uniref:2OG-Fe(II) oxygenase n=1 Tax=Reichenbachiella sp. TaxID=2184521 RepID=UPI0032632B8E
MSEFISKEYQELFYNSTKGQESYLAQLPFPNASFENFFEPTMLDEVLAEFPDLEKEQAIKFDDSIQKKFAGKGEDSFGPKTRQFMHFLNSERFLSFLQGLTGIEEVLMPDPYFIGGGLHEIKKGGLLKIHADFKKNEKFGLDRRINALVYLNKDWKEEYGGHFELWDQKIEKCERKILPKFNTLAIFSTTDYSFHGHPNPLTCPEDRSRKSLALYYYSNGRPSSEINPEKGEHETLFVPRAGDNEDKAAFNTKPPMTTREIIKEFIPPIVLRGLRMLRGSK